MSNTTDLYAHITHDVNSLLENGELTKFSVPTCTAVTWDWWNLHQGTAATKHEWRFLIRVAETDGRPPRTDLREIIRTQQNIYLPSTAFGW